LKDARQRVPTIVGGAELPLGPNFICFFSFPLARFVVKQLQH